MRHLRPLALILLALPVAACGSSSDSDAPAGPQAPVATQPVGGKGALRVGATGSGIGDALTGSAGGVQVLPSTPVPGVPNTETGVGAGASCEDAELLPTPDNLGAVTAATLCLLNGERADAGLRSLKENARLRRAALKHSQAMVDKQFFDHVGLNGSDPVGRIRAAGYIPEVGTWTVGENLAWGTGSLATPKAIVAAWMKSSGHRDNILRATYKEIGFGVVAGNPRARNGAGATFTTTFGAVSGTRKTRRARTARASKRRLKARTAAPRRR